jgi:hypothetical protein
MKEAAGRSFHHKVLVVQGLAPLGACIEAQSVAGDTASRRRRREPAAVPLSPVLTPTLPLRRTRPDEEEAAEDETEEVDDHIHVVTFGPGGCVIQATPPGLLPPSAVPLTALCPGLASTDDLEAWERTMRRKRKGSKVDNWDYYAMLELQDVRWRASVADLKEAFKRVSLRCAIRRACVEAAGGASRCCASRVYAPPSASLRCLAEKQHTPAASSRYPLVAGCRARARAQAQTLTLTAA